MCFVYLFVDIFEYSGGRCGPPPLVENAVASLNQTRRSVTITCMRGHRFPDGLTVKTFYCYADGTWDYNIPHCDGLYSNYSAFDKKVGTL